MRGKVVSSVRLSSVFVPLVMLVACGQNPFQRTAENRKIKALIERKMAFQPGSYAKGMIPAGEYAFASRTGGYYSETVNGQILDNTNFAAFGYVLNHGMGDIETRGTLITLDGLRELGFEGARGWYESMVGQKDYNFAGHYKIGADIPAGTYTVKSVGQAYVEISTGPVGNSSIIQNDNFNGTKTIRVLDGQYLTVSRGIVEGLPPAGSASVANEGVANTTGGIGSFRNPSDVSEVPAFVVGTWTHTGQDYRVMGAVVWERIVIRADGTMEDSFGDPLKDRWDPPETKTWEAYSGKYADTGERYFGIRVSGWAWPVVIASDGSLIMTNADGNVKFTRGDAFPFSK